MPRRENQLFGLLIDFVLRFFLLRLFLLQGLQFLIVTGQCLCLDGFDNAAHIIIRDERAVQTHQTPGSGCEVEHIASTK